MAINLPNDPTFFNPSINNPDNNALGYSRGVEAPNSLKVSEGNAVAKSISNQASGELGDLWGLIVNGSDTLIKKNIDEQVHDAVDSIRDPELGYTKPPAGVDDSNAPDDLVRQGKRLDNLTAARNAGKLSESHYWALMDMESRRLRATFGGHKDYIDQKFQDTTGHIPANKLREELISQAKAGLANSPEKQLDAFIKTDGQFLSDATTDKIKARDPTINLRDLALEAASTKKNQNILQMKALQVNSDEAARKPVVDAAKDTLGAGMTVLAQQHLSSDWGDLSKAISTAQKNGFSAEGTKSLVATYQAVRTKFDTEVADMIAGNNKNAPMNFSTTLEQKDIEEKIKPWRDYLDRVGSSIGKPEDLSIMASGQAIIKARTSADGNTMLDGSEELRRLNVVNDRLGSSGVALLGSVEGGMQVVGAAGLRLRDIYLGGMLVDNKNFDTLLMENKDKGAHTPEAMNYLKDSTIMAITNPKVSYEARKATFDRLFNSDPGIVLDPKYGFDNKGQNGGTPANVQYFRAVTSPDMVKAAKEFEQTNPGAYGRYKKFVANGTQVVSKQIFDDAKTLTESGAKLIWNDKTNEYSLDAKTLNPVQAANGEARYMQNSVTQLNQAIVPLINVYKADGEDVTASLARDLPTLGFNKDAPQQPSPVSKFFDGLLENLKENQPKVWSKLGGPGSSSDQGEIKDIPYKGPIPFPMISTYDPVKNTIEFSDLNYLNSRDPDRVKAYEKQYDDLKKKGYTDDQIFAPDSRLFRDEAVTPNMKWDSAGGMTETERMQTRIPQLSPIEGVLKEMGDTARLLAQRPNDEGVRKQLDNLRKDLEDVMQQNGDQGIPSPAAPSSVAPGGYHDQNKNYLDPSMLGSPKEDKPKSWLKTIGDLLTTGDEDNISDAHLKELADQIEAMRKKKQK